MKMRVGLLPVFAAVCWAFAGCATGGGGGGGGGDADADTPQCAAAGEACTQNADCCDDLVCGEEGTCAAPAADGDDEGEEQPEGDGEGQTDAGDEDAADDGEDGGTGEDTEDEGTDEGEDSGGDEGAFAIQTDAFSDGEDIPLRYAYADANISPALTFEFVPDGTVELALTVIDTDLPDGFTHWIIYGLPATTTGLAEAIPEDASPADPAGAMQGVNDYGEVGYGGPDPPPDETHHYVFTLYALSEPLDLEPEADLATFLAAIEGRILAEAELTGTYTRP